MAYGVKYRGEWRATTRGVRNYVVEILQRGYSGDVLPILLTGDCVTLAFGEVDESELQPIKSSEATITILCTEEGNPYIEFFTLDPAQYQVIITENGSEIWRGYLATGDYQQTLSRVPYTVRLRANDGFGILKAMPYLDGNGNKFDTAESVSSLLRRLLSPISESVDIWGYTPVYATQTSPTFDITSIPNGSIYNAFRDEVPTYYDVLEEVLRTFGVQLFQHNGALCVRSLSMLANALDSMVVDPIALRGADADGLGLKSDATLSFLPPLRKLSGSERETSANIELSESLCDPANWHTSADIQFTYISFSKYGKAMNIIAEPYPSEIIYNAGWTIIPTVLSPSANTKVAVSLDFFNRESSDISSLYVGVWLVAPGEPGNLLFWTDSSKTGCTLNIRQESIYWDSEKSKWVSLGSSKKSPTYSSLGLQRVNIDKCGVEGQRPALSAMQKASITFDIPNIPLGETDIYFRTRNDWQIAIVVAITKSRTSVYLANPVVSVEPAADVEIEPSDSISISDDGVTDESFSPKWIAGWPQTVDRFYPPLASLSSNKNIYGFIESMLDISNIGVVGKMLRDLRKRSTLTIEGDTDKPIRDGFNTVGKYDNRYYYVNSIARDLKRGLSSIQLRELAHLNNISGSITVGSLLINNYELPIAMVGLETSLYYLTSKNRLRRIVVPDGKPVDIATAELSSPTLRKGVGCVVLAEGSVSSNKVSAYDENGKLLAQVENFGDGFVSVLSWLATARYDAIAQVWIAADGRTVGMFDSDGYSISHFECEISYEDYATTITDAEIMPYNGGFFYRFHIAYEGISVTPGYRCYWHDYEIHKRGTFDENVLQDNIRFVSERFLAYIGNDGRWGLIARSGRDLESDGYIRFATFGNSYSVVALNNAIAVTVSANGVAVYDMRNTVSKYYTLGMGGGNSTISRCGDIVYAKDQNFANKYHWRRVTPIVGEGWKTLGGTREQFTFRPSAGDKSVRDESAVIRRIKGNTNVWGQLADISAPYTNSGNRYIITRNDDGSVSIKRDPSITSGYYCAINLDKSYRDSSHKYMFYANVTVSGVQSSTDYCGISVYNLAVMVGNHTNYRTNGHHTFCCFGSPDTTTSWQFAFYVYGVSELTIHNLQAFDLTDIFGAGNEPMTYEEFRQYYPDAYYPYSAPEIRSMRATGIETIGFNAFNGEYAEVIGGQAYYLGGAINTAHFATEVGGELKEITIPEDRLYTPSENGYIYATGSGICINLSHSGVRNGEYEPYEKNTLLLSEIAKYFPDGMHSIGDVCDEINQKWAIQRCATRAYQQGDENNALVKTDKINTVYMLAEPIYTLIIEPLQLDYKVDDFGTEKMLSNTPSAPFKADIEY